MVAIPMLTVRWSSSFRSRHGAAAWAASRQRSIRRDNNHGTIHGRIGQQHRKLFAQYELRQILRQATERHSTSATVRRPHRPQGCHMIVKRLKSASSTSRDKVLLTACTAGIQGQTHFQGTPDRQTGEGIGHGLGAIRSVPALRSCQHEVDLGRQHSSRLGTPGCDAATQHRWPGTAAGQIIAQPHWQPMHRAANRDGHWDDNGLRHHTCLSQGLRSQSFAALASSVSAIWPKHRSMGHTSDCVVPADTHVPQPQPMLGKTSFHQSAGPVSVTEKPNQTGHRFATKRGAHRPDAHQHRTQSLVRSLRVIRPAQTRAKPWLSGNSPPAVTLPPAWPAPVAGIAPRAHRSLHQGCVPPAPHALPVPFLARGAPTLASMTLRAAHVLHLGVREARSKAANSAVRCCSSTRLNQPTRPETQLEKQEIFLDQMPTVAPTRMARHAQHP